MLDFGKIYSEFDEEFKPDCNIEVGHVVGYIPELVVRFMETWCFRLDLVMEHDKKVNGGHTEVSDELLRYRGFTYSEYKDLFDATIPSERYLHYPAYERLDIQSDIERNRFILGKTYEQDNYVKALETCDVREVLSFFFKDFPACVALDDLFMNTSIIAPPGSGKTFMMRTWLHRLINKYKDFSFVIIDPHGDVARKLFESTLLRDRERFVYLDPKFINDGYAFTYNIFDIKDISPLTENQTVDQIEDAITELVTSDSTLSTSIASVLSHCIYFLIQRGNSTIQDLYDLITVKQPILAEAQRHDSYFANNFVKSDSRSRDAIERRISRLVTGIVPRSLLSGKSTFNLEAAINSNKVVIVNLAGLGQLTRDAVGKFIIANIKSYAAKRVPDTHHTIVAVDECHNFVSGSYEYILEQLRKYGLHMILANQHLEQLGGNQISVKKNTAVKIFSGESSSEVKGFVEVPKYYLKGKDLDKEGNKNIDLQRFEFLMKPRFKQMMKIKSPDFLLKNKYKLSEKEIEENEKYMLEKYYKKIDLSYTTADAAMSTDSGRGKPPRDLDEPE